MGINGICDVILFLFFFCDLSSAWSFRTLIDSEPKDKPLAERISPLPSPVSDGGYQTNTTTSADGDKPKEEDNQQQPVMKSPEVDLDPKETDNTVNITSTAVTPLKDNHQIDEEKGNTPNKTSLGSDSSESCNDPTKTCKTGEMTACFQGLGNGIKNIVIIVHNEGEITIRVTVKLPSLENTTVPLEIHGQQTGKIDIPVTDDSKIILNAGNGDCELNINGPSSLSPKEDIWQKFQFYYKQVTPIYGAYLFFVLAIMVGGTWSYCKFRKRRQVGEIPYQELEMGSPGSSSAVNIDSAEGWDQVWDDDWDDEKAVRSPGGHNHIESISENRLPTRSSNNRLEDGWENDWDD